MCNSRQGHFQYPVTPSFYCFTVDKQNLKLPHMVGPFRRTIPEQQELLREFDDPLEFMMLYIHIFEQQLRCSTKVFLHQIPYYKKFQIDFLNRLLQLCLDEPLNQLTLVGIEEKLYEWRNRKLYCPEFYACCVSSVLKGMNILLDRAEAEVLSGNLDALPLLYRYSFYKIDVTGLLKQTTLEELSRDNYAVIRTLRDSVKRLNDLLKTATTSGLLKLECSHSASCQDRAGQGELLDILDIENKKAHTPTETVHSRDTLILNKASCMEHSTFDASFARHDVIKTELSERVIGQQRVTFYDFENIIREIVEEIRTRQKDSSDHNAFLTIMAMAEELSKIDEPDGSLQPLIRDLIDSANQSIR